jgi:hypothetical protein
MSAGDTEVMCGDLVIRTVVVRALATNAYVLFDRLTHHAIDGIERQPHSLAVATTGSP